MVGLWGVILCAAKPELEAGSCKLVLRRRVFGGFRGQVRADIRRFSGRSGRVVSVGKVIPSWASSAS